MNVSPASSLSLSVSLCVCVSVSVTGSAYYLWTRELYAPFSIRYSPFAIRLFNVAQYVVIADVPAEYVAQSQGPRSHFHYHFRTQPPNNASPPTHGNWSSERKSESDKLVWYLSLKWINLSMGPSPICCNYKYLVA